MRLFLVVEFNPPELKSGVPWDWGTTTRRYIALDGKASQSDVGAFLIAVAAYGDPELDLSRPESIFRKLRGDDVDTDADGWVVAGGAAFEHGDVRINPGCCCGIESWEEWTDPQGPNFPPWWGHDPSPFIRRVGDRLQVLADGGLGPLESSVIVAELDVETYERLAREFRADLRAFARPLEQWLILNAPTERWVVDSYLKQFTAALVATEPS